MIRAVVKWSYVKGVSGLGKAKAHMNYIQFREGEDRGSGPREFFNEDKGHVQGREIKERLDELEQRGVQVHKFIFVARDRERGDARVHARNDGQLFAIETAR